MGVPPFAALLTRLRLLLVLLVLMVLDRDEWDLRDTGVRLAVSDFIDDRSRRAITASISGVDGDGVTLFHLRHRHEVKKLHDH